MATPDVGIAVATDAIPGACVTVAVDDAGGATLICDAARLPDGAARTLAASLGVLLHVVADGSAEALPIDRLPVMAAAERARLLEAWNDTAIAYDDRCMHTLIEAQAARTPDAPAVVFEAETLTYAELDARANRVARVLRTMGVGPDTPRRPAHAAIAGDDRRRAGDPQGRRRLRAARPRLPRRADRPLSRRQRRARGR